MLIAFRILFPKNFITMLKKILPLAILVLFASCHNKTSVNAENITLANDTIPFSMVDSVPEGVNVVLCEEYNRIFVNAVIHNDTVPLLLDCGFPYSLFDRDFFSEIGQSYSTIRIDNDGDEKISTNLTVLLGKTPISIDTCYSRIEYTCKSYCRGILGMEFFDHHIIEIDFKNKRLIVYSELPDKISKYKRLDLFRVPEDEKYGLLPRVNFDGFITRDGATVSASLLVDLGAPYTGWYKPFRMNITTDSTKQNFNSDAYDLLRRVGQLNDYAIPVTEMHMPKVDGNLGVDYFSEHNVIFDYPHNKIYLQPNDK